MTDGAIDRVDSHVASFTVSQRFTAMVNRYEIRELDSDGKPGAWLAFAEQKRLKIKEEVHFFSDDTKSQELFWFKSRQRLDLAARTDIFNIEGAMIGWFEKDFKKSLLRSTWHMHYAGVEAKGQERSSAIALVRRFVDLPFQFHFDFVDVTDANMVMTVDRRFGLRDRYNVSVPDHRLGFATAAAMTVALDAFQGR